jgi:RNA polymerase sigma-70 factor (ECF subfamily)
MEQSTDMFEFVFRTHEPRIRDYCARRVDPDSVEDVVSETFTVAWRKVDEMPGGDSTLPWLYGVARRLIQHEWRRTARRGRLDLRSPRLVPATDPTVDDLVDRDERRRVLEAAARLAADDQEILRLTLWEELTPTDAAIVLGISVDAAKQRARRARRRLATAYHRLSQTPDTRTSAEEAVS